MDSPTSLQEDDQGRRYAVSVPPFETVKKLKCGRCDLSYRKAEAFNVNEANKTYRCEFCGASYWAMTPDNHPVIVGMDERQREFNSHLEAAVFEVVS